MSNLGVLESSYTVNINNNFTLISVHLITIPLIKAARPVLNTCENAKLTKAMCSLASLKTEKWMIVNHN